MTVPNTFFKEFDGVPDPTIVLTKGSLAVDRSNADLYISDGVIWILIAKAGAVLIVANIAALALLDTTGFKEDTQCWVQTLREPFTVLRTNTQTPNAITVVAAKLGAGTNGNWIRNGTANPSWRYQATWFINPASGNDENTGIDSGHALKTWAEISRRWGKDPEIYQQTDVVITGGDLPYGDPVTVQGGILNLAASGTGTRADLRVSGEQTTITTGSVTAFSSANQATREGAHILGTLSVGTWTTYLNKLCVITSGPRIGVSFWIAADLGGGVARVTSPVTTDDGISSSLLAIESVLQAGDQFKVVSTNSVPTIVLEVEQRGTDFLGNFMRMGFRDLSINPSGINSANSGYPIAITDGVGTKAWMSRCWLSGGMSVVSKFGFSVLSSRVSSPIMGGKGLTFFSTIFSACLFSVGGVDISIDHNISILQNSVIQGSRLIVGRGVRFSAAGCGIFDSPAEGIRSSSGALPILVSLNTAPGPATSLYGNGNTTYGVALDPSSGGMNIQTTAGAPIPTINGSLGLGRELKIGDTDATWDQVPVVSLITMTGVTVL